MKKHVYKYTYFNVGCVRIGILISVNIISWGIRNGRNQRFSVYICLSDAMDTPDKSEEVEAPGMSSFV